LRPNGGRGGVAMFFQKGGGGGTPPKKKKKLPSPPKRRPKGKGEKFLHAHGRSGGKQKEFHPSCAFRWLQHNGRAALDGGEVPGSSAKNAEKERSTGKKRGGGIHQVGTQEITVGRRGGVDLGAAQRGDPPRLQKKKKREGKKSFSPWRIRKKIPGRPPEWPDIKRGTPGKRKGGKKTSHLPTLVIKKKMNKVKLVLDLLGKKKPSFF